MSDRTVHWVSIYLHIEPKPSQQLTTAFASEGVSLTRSLRPPASLSAAASELSPIFVEGFYQPASRYPSLTENLAQSSLGGSFLDIHCLSPLILAILCGRAPRSPARLLRIVYAHVHIEALARRRNGLCISKNPSVGFDTPLSSPRAANSGSKPNILQCGGLAYIHALPAAQENPFRRLCREYLLSE